MGRRGFVFDVLNVGRRAHLMIRNQERVDASLSKETSNHGAHKRCSTKEEEELLIRLEAQLEGNKNINRRPHPN